MADGSKRALALCGAAVAAFASLLGACANREPTQQSAAQEVTMKTVVIPVEGMSCSACAARVKKALTSINGVASVEVNLAERNTRVRFDPSKLAPDRLVSAVNGLGYQAGPPAETR